MKRCTKWILAVADDPQDLFWMREAVAHASVDAFDYEFSTAGSCAQARRLFEKVIRERPNGENVILFCDVNFPGESGLQLLKWFRAQPRFLDVPVIALSSLDRRTDTIRAFELGAVACLFKPPQLNATKGLLRAIEQLGSAQTEVAEPNGLVYSQPRWLVHSSASALVFSLETSIAGAYRR